MSTKLHDLPHNTVWGHSIPPDLYTETQVGRSVDLIDADGNGFLIAAIVASTTPVPVTITAEESNDGSTWTSVALSTLPSISAPFDRVVSAQFVRSKRYARAVLTADEDSDVRASVVIGQQQKTI